MASRSSFAWPRLFPLALDEKQQLRASQNLLSLGLICMFAVVQHIEVLMGLIDPFASNCLTAFNVGTSLACHLLIRSGWNLRLAPADPSLTLLQSLLAISALAWSYAITGPARGSLLAIMVLVILFGGLFRLRPAQSRWVALYALVLVASVMAWRTLWARERYDSQVELVHFAFLVIVLTGASLVATSLGRMQARLASQKSELTKALELSHRLATRDSLTGLLNRRAMLDVLAQEGPRQHLSERRVALAMIDIDHFKRINDGHGHAVGDAVLQRVAEVARAGMRQGDVLARWGGEEFLLLMPHTAPSDAAKVLQRLRESVASAGFESLAAGLTVTFSAGLTQIAPYENHETAIERADRALYRAKHAGRNRTEHG